MSARSLRAGLPGLWPHRLRTRLALFYSVLFVAAGLGVLALAYTVATKLVTTIGPRVTHLTPSQEDVLQLCKPPPTSTRLIAECDHLLGLLGATQNGTALAAVKIAAGVGVLLLVPGAVALGRLAAERALRPVRSITDAARQASDLQLGQRLALSGPEDEFKQLADTFDVMLERLDAAFTSQKRFVANAAHELRTPLTAMRTAIEVTLAKPARTPEQLEEMAARVKRAVERADATIEALLTLASSELGASASEMIDLATAAEDALDSARPQIDQCNITVEATLQPAQTRGDRVLLERMVANLVENAVRHNHAGGWIAVHTHAQNGGSVLEVTNTGPVVPADQLPALFEPFARAHERIDFQDGAGLGLSIAEAIARAHDSTITASPRPEGGLHVSVTLPRSAAER
jgi:signal transduction histidine kinase